MVKYTCIIITDAVRCNKDFANTKTEKTIEDVIKEWFRHSKNLDCLEKDR